MGQVGIFSPNFFRARDELWSTNEKVTARILIHPNCSYVSWRNSICQVVLFGVIHQLPLLREEFRLSKLSKFTLHSDLRRQAASRLALPCPSSWQCRGIQCAVVVVVKQMWTNAVRWTVVALTPVQTLSVASAAAVGLDTHLRLIHETVTVSCLYSS